jgi:hypothetical protein
MGSLSSALAALAFLGLVLPLAHAVRTLPRAPYARASRYGKAAGEAAHLARSEDLISQCDVRYRETNLDHFSW